MLRKPAFPHYVTSSSNNSWKMQRFFSVAEDILTPGESETLLHSSFHLPRALSCWAGMKQTSEHLQWGILEIAFLFRERTSRYRKKSECLKLCCGAVIALSLNGRWKQNELPHLSLLGVMCWKCWMISFQLKWPLPAPLSSDSSMFLLDSSWQSNGLFLSFELPWIFLTCGKSLMMHRLYYSLNQNWAFSRSSWEIQTHLNISCFV